MMPPGFPGLPSGWKHDWDTFPSEDGKVQLYAQTLSAPDLGERKPCRVLVVLHGMGEHGGRYLHLPHFLKSAVDAVVILDHRGHGKSEGLRGHAESFDELVNDAAMAVTRTHQKFTARYGSSEVHLLGHSLGGHVAIRMQFLHPELPLASVTACAPFLGIKQHVPVWKKIGGNVMSSLFGTLQLETGLDVESVSRDQAVVDTLRVDRLAHTKMTTQFFVGLMAAMKETMLRHEGINPPIQILVPLDDRIVNAELSQEFYRNLKHADKWLKTYPETFHEPMHDFGKEQVFADIQSWIELHSGVAKVSSATRAPEAEGRP